MKTLTAAKQKIINQQLEIKNKIGSIEIEAGWFRRVFHTFAASFLIYYLLPDEPLINMLKIYFVVGIVFFVFILEYLRIKETIHSSNFFGLRTYEEKRPASYVYFGVATLILLLFFPQQIAIPCILCACFSDPIIGEIRHRYGKKEAYIIGFFVCMFFFLITWYTAEIWIVILVSLIGASAAVIGEAKKFWLIDDDFMIQMLPATILLLLWQGILFGGISILPAELIIPI
jgi:dolichol kinase